MSNETKFIKKLKPKILNKTLWKFCLKNMRKNCIESYVKKQVQNHKDQGQNRNDLWIVKGKITKLEKWG
jgi:hypothetical protein